MYFQYDWSNKYYFLVIVGSSGDELDSNHHRRSSSPNIPLSLEMIPLSNRDDCMDRIKVTNYKTYLFHFKINTHFEKLIALSTGTVNRAAFIGNGENAVARNRHPKWCRLLEDFTSSRKTIRTIPRNMDQGSDGQIFVGGKHIFCYNFFQHLNMTRILPSII